MSKWYEIRLLRLVVIQTGGSDGLMERGTILSWGVNVDLELILRPSWFCLTHQKEKNKIAFYAMIAASDSTGLNWTHTMN